MSLDSFANKIMSLVFLGMLIFIAGVGASVEYVREGLNSQSSDDSIRQVAQRMETLHAQTRLIAKDYNNWAGVYEAAMKGDIGYIADNYGITAINGDIFDRAVMFDGPFDYPVMWAAGGSRSPDTPRIDSLMIERIREGVSGLTLGSRPTLDYMTFEDGRLIFNSASRLLPDTPETMALALGSSAPIAVISRALRDDEINTLSSDIDLDGLSIGASSEGETSLELPGLYGPPVAYLSWSPPKPGDELVKTIAPLLSVIMLAVMVLSISGGSLLRRNARALVEREAQATKLARVDFLTGLPNRLAFMEKLQDIVSFGREQVAVIVIDLDRFKNVNDLVGHAGGDDVIRQYAARLQTIVSESRFIARTGGDEFVLIVTDELDAALAASDAAQEIMAAADHPFTYQDCRFDLAASCGISFRHHVSESGEELLRRADRAMYHSKCRSGSQVSIYEPEMDALLHENRKIGRALRAALQDSKEFYVHFQSIVNSQNGTLIGVEALARWESEELGFVGPSTFIPIAENCGLIGKLGEIVLTAVCASAQNYPWLKISVNVSPLELLSSDFISRVMSILMAHDVAPGQIEFEMTEGVAIRDVNAVCSQLFALQQLGFSTALDDFGTGFSSIGYLRQMPFDTLKIDRSFVSGLTSQEIRDVVGPMVLLGHSLGKTITAEGVETSAEARWLCEAGCDRLQGYAFGRPQPIHDLVSGFDARALAAAE